MTNILRNVLGSGHAIMRFRAGLRAITYSVLLGLCGCAGLAPTYRAVVRRTEGDRLMMCMAGSSDRQDCVAESVRRCRAAGLERSCATDETWGR